MVAVNEVSFEVAKGRVFAILGPNGSGKTTLLRMLSTLLSADSGSIEVSGYKLPKDAVKVRASIGFLTGSAALHKKLTPLETLELFAGLQGLSAKIFRERKEELVEKLDLGDLMRKQVGTLSMGQKQRVMIARTLLHDPEVVIFDEATAGLDVLAAKVLMDMIRECRDAGKTVLFATHIMGEVSMLADDLLILHKGNVLFDDTFEVLQQRQEARSLEEEFVRILEGKGRELPEVNQRRMGELDSEERGEASA